MVLLWDFKFHYQTKLSFDTWQIAGFIICVTEEDIQKPQIQTPYENL